jgi:chromosome segregation ATPase
MKLNVGKLWERFTDVNKANEQIENTWEVLRQVVDNLGHDHCRTTTQKARNEGRRRSSSLTSNVRIAVEELNTALGRLQERDKDIERLRAKITVQEADLREWAVKHRDDMATMSAKIAELESEAAQQKKRALTLLEEVKCKHSDRLKRWQERADTIETNLKRDIRPRNTALVARDTVAQLTDGELKAIFSDLTCEVDVIARLKWTSNRSAWTPETKLQVSDTPTRLQRCILQDTIWDIFSKCQ